MAFLKSKSMIKNWDIKHMKSDVCVGCVTPCHKKEFLESVKENKSIIFSVWPRTKTTVNIEMLPPVSSVSGALSIAVVPTGGEKFKYIHKTSDSIWGSAVRSYFKIGPKQRLEEFKEYLSLVLDDLKLGIDEIDVTLNITNVTNLY